MTPTKKGKTTHIRIEKKKKGEVDASAAEHGQTYHSSW
jgi:hypothetical protein